MKVWCRCDKCGESFETEENVRTDVCPHCMSFVDIAEPRISRKDRDRAPAEKEGNARSGGDASAERGCPKEKHAAADGIKKGGAAEMYESLLLRAQTHCDRKEWREAADCYEKCLGYPKDWRTDFGIIFSQTRGLTDFSQFTFAGYGSAKTLAAHVRAAFSEMPEEKRKQYAARYLPLLQKRRAELCVGRTALDGAFPRAREELRRITGANGDIERDARRSKRKSAVAICLFSGLFLLAAAGSVLCFLAQAHVFAAVAVFLAAFFAAGVLVSAVSFQKLKHREKIDETLRFSYESTIQNKKLLEEVSERTSEQIEAIDLISGYLRR